MTTEAVIKATWRIDAVHTRVRFDPKYLLPATVSDWFREVEGCVKTSSEDFNNSEIRLTINTRSLFTGNEERDGHLQPADFFDVEKYPAITFQSTRVQVKDNDISIAGTLTIKAVYKRQE